MSRHDHRAVDQEAADGGGDAGHGGRIEPGRWLVQQEDGRRADEGPGQGHALALAGAQGQPTLAEASPEPLGEMGHQVAQPDCLHHFLELAIGRFGRAEAEVLGHAGGEEVRALGKPCEMVAPPTHVNVRRRCRPDRHGA